MKRTQIIKEIMRKLTTSYIKQMPTPPMKNGKHTYQIYRDNTMVGFAIRVSSTGTKTFIVDKKTNNKLHRIVLGKFGDLTVDDARKQAQKCLGQLAMGINPLDEKKRSQALGITLQQAFEEYLSTRKTLKPRTRFDYEKIIDREFSDWAVRPLASITKEMVATRHKKNRATHQIRSR